MSSKYLWIAVLGCGAIAGCTSVKQSHIGDEDRAFGESVKYDTAVQIINPAPVYTADSTQPGSNGDAGASAVQRYRTDKVKPVEQLQTTERMVSGAGAGSTSGPQ